jgi:alanyl-tRNA synthetase
MVTKDLTERGLNAGDIIRGVATVAGGSGGGRPEVAQAGGKDATRLGDALAEVEQLVRERLALSPS